MTAVTDEHLRLLPKVELHCHAEGASRASTIQDLARRHGVRFPVDEPADGHVAVARAFGYSLWERFGLARRNVAG